VTLNAKGGGTIQFLSAVSLGNTLDAGQASVAPPLVGETIVNGENSQAFSFQTFAGQDIGWDLHFIGTPFSTGLFTLQGSMDAAFTSPGVLDATNVVASDSLRWISNKQSPFMRVNVSSLSGGDGTSQVVIRLYTRYRGAAS
jgi:hypothetical protein